MSKSIKDLVLTEINDSVFRHKKGSEWELYPSAIIPYTITIKKPVQLLIPFIEYSNPYSSIHPSRDFHIAKDFFLYSGLR